MPGLGGLKPLSSPRKDEEEPSGPAVPSKTYSLEELKKVPAGVEKSRIVVCNFFFICDSVNIGLIYCL